MTATEMKRKFLAFALPVLAFAFGATNALATLSVSITSPASNASFGSGATVTISANASPTTGKTVTKVEFFYGGTNLIGTDTTSPYSVTWVPSAPGTYSLTAKITDSGNNTKTSTAVSIKVLAPPNVSVTSPLDGDSFLPGDTVSIAAAATAATGASISKVQFFSGATLLGQDTTSPYTFTWTNVPAGNYAITALATDSKSGTARSAPVNITVAVPHTPPDVSITSPVSGSVTQGPANYTLTASVTPYDGASITKVDYYNGSSLLGTATAPPYSFNWSNVGAGGYLLSAVATDSTGTTNTSSLVYAIVDGADTCDTAPPLTALEKKTKLAQFGNTPLTFEENAGQTDREVRFLARGNGYQLFLTPAGSTVALRSDKGDRAAAVRMRFAGGNADAAMSGLDRSPTITNYLIGRDPSRWHTHVANYASVRYDSVYPGVDAVYHASRGALEYDLHVAPKADAKRIRLAFEGAEAVSVDAQGDLVLRTAAGSIAQKRPVAYQEIGGERREVSARYRIVAKNRVAIALGDYDRSHELVIDPVLVYSTYLSGSDNSSGADAIALSRCGEAFVAGYTWASDFPTTAGAFDPSGAASSMKGFVSKLSQDGSALVYSTYVTGTQFNASHGWVAQVTELVSIAVDGTGHAYVSGNTNAMDFPITPNAIFPFQPSDPAGVVAKLTTDGSALEYATYMDGTDQNVPGIAVDSSGNAYIANSHRIRKLSVDGTSVVYSFIVDAGPGSSDRVTGVAVDASGNAYATGVTFSSFLPVTAGAFETARPNSTSFASGYVAKVNPGGTALVFGTYFGNTGTLQPSSIALDASGNVYVAGFADGKAFPVALGASHMFNMDFDQTGNRYAFAGRLSADGSHGDWFSWIGGMFCDPSSQFCSAAQSQANGIAVDSSSAVWITGTTGSNRIPFVKPLGTGSATATGNFVAKLAPSGTSMAFGTLLVGTTVGTPAPNGRSDPSAMGVQVDSIGSAYIVGRTDALDYPTTAGALQPTPRSNFIVNAFVTKINETKDTTTSLAVSPSPASVGNPVTLTATITGNAPSGIVTFYDGAASIGTAAVSGTTAQLVTSALAGGVHTALTAAYSGDAHNNPSTSTAASINVNNPAGQPSVSMTGIADGANLVANSGTQYTGAQVSVTASAAAGNILTSVTVYFGANTFFWTPNSPSMTGTVPLPALNPGFYTIYADAVDNFGNRTTTPTVRFVVNSSTATAPTVALTAPLDGATLIAPGPFALSATATASGTASIANVVFYANGSQIGSSSTSPFSASWSNALAGTYSVMALATDTAGATRLSAAASVTVSSPPPPAVSLNSPSNGSTFFTTDAIPVSASATASGGATITRVEILVDGSVIATLPDAPYNFNWVGAPTGNHSIAARAYDSRGIVGQSATISVTVSNPPSPTVAITSPASGASFSTPASFSVAADATPGTGATIAKVDFFDGANLVGTVNSAPYAITVSNAAIGPHSFTAIVTDSRGATATSNAVAVSVLFGQASISVDAGIDGSSVADAVAVITGTVQVPSNSGVSVNGFVGNVTTDGRFFINDVPLQPGVNSLPVIVATQGGQTATQTVTITRTGSAPFSVMVDKDTGIAPLDVAFSVDTTGGSVASTIEFDIDGNGTADYIATSMAQANPVFTFSTPGYNRAIVRFKDAQGNVLYTATKVIYVVSTDDRFNLLKGIYTGMLDSLRAGNMTDAVTALTAEAATEFQPVFTALGTQLSSAIDRLGSIDRITFSSDVAEIVLSRTVGTQQMAFSIYLIRGPDGIWRIESM